MDAYRTVNEWLSKINPQDQSLALDQYGQCQLVHPENGTCNIFIPSATSAHFVLYADLRHLPEKLDPEKYESLLALNIVGMKSGGGMVGLDTQMRSLVYFYSRDIGATDLNLFCTVLQNFFASAADVKKGLSRIFSSPADDTPKRKSPPSQWHRSFAAQSAQAQ